MYKMSFSADSMTVNAILKHQEHAKQSGKRQSRSDSINDLVSHGDLLETLWRQYGDDIKAATVAGGSESTLGLHSGRHPREDAARRLHTYRRFLERTRRQIISRQTKTPPAGRALHTTRRGLFYLTISRTAALHPAGTPAFAGKTRPG